MKELIIYFLICSLSILEVSAQKEEVEKSTNITNDSISHSSEKKLFSYKSLFKN